ncbi:SUMF1/EgtB/PvdO family nonheme iron enzyme [Achromobacter sp. 413638]|uniref:SUMF1/EgtB/PvdO family nonheme iron enzyme n=1 Tax=Achromobacter sp. 413638 TaxID=3342385 RepID=UPI00370CF098
MHARPLVLALLLSLSACGGDRSRAPLPPMSRLPPGEVSYTPPGEALRKGYPVAPAPLTARFPNGLAIMTRQVSQAEYAACVRAGGCRTPDPAQRGATAPDMPAAGISWSDASAYAAWLSAATGRQLRLPTYAEWVYAAGPAFIDDALAPSADDGDPAQRWLAEYDQQARRAQAGESVELRPFGGHGANPAGLQDMAGSVWDWTSDCHTRRVLDAAPGEAGQEAGNCGIRVAAGRHIAYLPDFIRDPKSGACSVGLPPANLGLRLVLAD